VHNQAFDVGKISPQKYFSNFKAYNKKVETPLIHIDYPTTLSAKTEADIQRLKTAYLKRIGKWPSSAKVSEKTMQAIHKACEKRGLKRASNGKSVNGTIGHPGHFWGEASRVATAFQQSDNPQQKNELRQIFMNYVDLTIQQGHGAGYGLRTAFVRPLWLMKDELKKAKKWDTILKKMRSITHASTELYKKSPSLNVDFANTELACALYTIFLQDDPKRIYQDLKATQHWLETVARNGEMKPDGSLFHHNQYYSGYNIPATPPLVDLICMLDDTEFNTPTMHLYLRRIAYSFHLLSASVDLPRTFSGRHASAGASLNWGFATIYRKLAFLKQVENQNNNHENLLLFF